MAVSAPSAVQAVAAARLALAQTLLVSAGQVVSAVVVGKTPAGLTTLKIGDQLVQAQLPQSLPVGTTLQLAVKAGGATPQLVIVSQTLPGQATAVAPQAVAATPLQLLPEVVVAGSEKQVAASQAANAVRLSPANAESVQQLVAQPSRNESAVAPATTARGTAPVSAPVAGASVATTVQPAAAQTAAAQTAIQPGVTISQTAAVTVSPQPAAAVAGSVSAEVVQSNAGAAAQAQGRAAEASRPAVAAGNVSPSALPAARQIVMSGPVSQMPATAGVLPPLHNQQAPGQSLGGTAVTQAVAMVASEPPAALAQSRTVQVPTPGSIAPEPEASNPLLVAQAAVRPQATMADLPKPVVPAVVAVAPPTPPQPATPQAALAQMVPEAMARQNSVGPLLMSLAAVVERAGVLPEPVLRAALGVLAQRIVIADGKVVAAELEHAVAKSGVYLEAGLAKSVPQPADAKSALLNLREVLGKWLGGTPVPLPVRDAAPPPLRGLPLRAPAAEIPPLPDGAREVARALHGQADAAVSRTKLMQMASLPDADPARPAAPSVRMELPFLIGHELVMAQIQIARDGTRREAERKRGWTMRFALNFSATGEVGAEVGLLGKAVNVALWAVEPETAEAMQAALPELADALAAIGLDPGAIRIRQGAPAPEKPASGRLLDSVS